MTTQTQPEKKTGSRLGKGLAALMPGPAITAGPAEASPNGASEKSTALVDGAAGGIQKIESSSERIPGISMVGVKDIQVNPYQPRQVFEEDGIEELTQSIRENGIIQPLIVRKTPEGYQLIAGERRLRAAKAAGVKHVPIVIRRTTDRQSLELALIENIQRRDLNCVDQALAYYQLQEDFSLTQEEISKKVAKDRASVANHLRVLKLPQEILEALKKQELSFGHAKALLMVDDREVQLMGFKKMTSEGMSVRSAEDYMGERKKEILLKEAMDQGENPEPKPRNVAIRERFAALSKEMTQTWSTKVEFKGTEKKGRVTISWGSRQDLDRILENLQNSSV